MSLRSLAVLSAVVVLSGAVFAQEPRRDGRWDVKMEMSVPGMPAMPPMSQIQCITVEDAADPAKTVPQGRGGPPPNCKMEEYKVTGPKVNFVMKCEGPEAATTTGEFVYGTDTYDGTMKVDMNRGGQAMSMTMKIAAKRLGDCTK